VAHHLRIENNRALDVTIEDYHLWSEVRFLHTPPSETRRFVRGLFVRQHPIDTARMGRARKATESAVSVARLDRRGSGVFSGQDSASDAPSARTMRWIRNGYTP
jgi:hypothetical protein